mmetsp:Transcript_142378/g.258860  ORF Transcript_142378/g.258860 Transcript_142378/m.258860 type:complete len:405 (+) Transcript_142378:47-1261(+)
MVRLSAVALSGILPGVPMDTAAESSEDPSPRTASARTQGSLPADAFLTEAPDADAFLTEAPLADASLTEAPVAEDAGPDSAADAGLDGGTEEPGELVSKVPEFELKIRLPSTTGLAGTYCKVPGARREWTTEDVKEAVEIEAGIPAREQRLYEENGLAELHNTVTLDLLSPDNCVELRLERRHPENARWISRVETRGSLFSAASASVRKDREVALAAVANHGRSLQYVSDELKKDRDVVLAAVRNDGYALRFAAPILKHDKEIVFAAVTQNGLALAFAADELIGDKDLVLTAASKNGLALQFASGHLRGEWQARELAKSTGAYDQLKADRKRRRHLYAEKDDGRWPACKEWSPRCLLRDNLTIKKVTQQHGRRREARRGAIHGGIIFLDTERWLQKRNGSLKLF